MDLVRYAISLCCLETRSASWRRKKAHHQSRCCKIITSCIASARQSRSRYRVYVSLAVKEPGFTERQAPLHDEALSGGEAIFSWSHVCGIATDCAVGLPPRRPQYRDLVRMGVTLLSQCSRLFSQAQFGEHKVPNLRGPACGWPCVIWDVRVC